MEYYIFFNDVENAKKLYMLMKNESIKCTIAPTPRTESKVCGVSILYYDAEDKTKIEKIIEENTIDIMQFYEKKRDNDPNRMRFC